MNKIILFVEFQNVQLKYNLKIIYVENKLLKNYKNFYGNIW